LKTPDVFDLPPRLGEWLVVGAVALVVSVGYCSPLFATWSNWGISDWDVHLALHAVPELTVTEYGQFPLWNPYACGGMVMFANPLTRVLSPFFPLHLLFGFLAAIKLEIVAHLAVGLFGTYLLARDVLRSRVGAAMSATVFMLNGTYTHTLTMGMVPFMCLAYLPWTVLGFVRSAARPIYLWLAGAGLALLFFEGGAYLVAITLLGLAVLAAVESLQRRSPVPLVRLLASGVLMLGLGAVKFFPSIALMRMFPRNIDEYSGYSLSSLATSLFSRRFAAALRGFDHVPGFWHGMSYGADENCMYIGVVAGLLFVVGVWTKHQYRPAWLALVLTTLCIAFGDRIQPSLWQLVHHLPVYDSMRVAQRFRVVMLLGVALFCGLGAMSLTQVVLQRFGIRHARWVGGALVLLVASDVISATYSLMKHAFALPALMAERRPEPFQQYFRTPAEMLSGALRNIGTIDCYEPLFVPRNAIPSESPRYSGEVFLQGTSGKVEMATWSPNRLRLNVVADGPGWVIVNQHGYPGWKVEQGNAVTAMICENGNCERRRDGLLAVEVSPGKAVLDVYYRPDSFVFGVATSFTFLFGFIVSWRMRRRVVEDTGLGRTILALFRPRARS
jgi:hypothetical protein